MGYKRIQILAFNVLGVKNSQTILLANILSRRRCTSKVKKNFSHSSYNEVAHYFDKEAVKPKFPQILMNFLRSFLSSNAKAYDAFPLLPSRQL